MTEAGGIRTEVARIREAIRRFAPEPAPRHSAIAVPRWVPDFMQKLYVEIALADGEEEAASMVRGLKRRMTS